MTAEPHANATNPILQIEGVKMSFDFSNARVEAVTIHQVGNKLKEEILQLSESVVGSVDAELEHLLQRFFFHGFKSSDEYAFYHDTDLRFNEVYEHAKECFSSPNSFYSLSRGIAKKLYEVSTHPNIRAGDLYIALLRNVLFDGQECSALGIFKSETKEPYLKTVRNNGVILPTWEVGTNPSILDKGCIIFDIDSDSGYNVVVIDTKSRNDAKYWIDDFLHLIRRDSNYRKTQTVTTACKQFIVENTVEDKSQKTLALNKLVEYISENESIDISELATAVCEAVPSVQGMEEYVAEYAAEQGVEIEQSFIVDEEAVKKAKRSIRTSIKLDTGIEIKVSSPSSEQQQYVERGYDKDRGMYYYKVYFHNEKE